MIIGGKVLAAPRQPLPPLPDVGPLYYEGFDEPYITDQVDAEVVVPGLGNFEESWSGYALQRSGTGIAPFVITALSGQGATNIASDTSGALRFWVRPHWSTGSGPGIFAPLLTFYAVADGQALLCWWLEVSPDGSALTLVNQTDAGPQTLLTTPIDWQTGQSYLLTLDFGTNGAALFLGNQLAGQGNAPTPISPTAGELALGSDITGEATAGADLDEFYSFGAPLTQGQLTAYCILTTNQAALGPIPDTEMQGTSQMSSIHSPGNVYDPDHDVHCSPGGRFYMTNVVATVLTNGTTTVSFDIQGGTNGIFYDIFATPTLSYSLASNQWTWIGQGLTCNTYTFSNQPFGESFYVLELPAITETVAFGQNSSNQCGVPNDLTNAVAVAAGGYFSAALLNNGTVRAWGGDGFGETNPPTALTNVISIAAGYLHGVALRANGSVTNWGYYWDSGGANASVTNRLYCTAPPLSNVVAIAAGNCQDLALMSNGTVVAWGLTGAYGTLVPTNLNLTNVAAIACGWDFNLALSSNGTVTAWGYNAPSAGYFLTNVPADLITNTAAIAAGGFYSFALRKNGTVEGWGDTNLGFSIPAGLSNVVAVSTGGSDAFALRGDGSIVGWNAAGSSTSLTNIPAGVAGVKGISCGLEHNLVLESGILNPVIFTQPANQYAPAGGSATFSVAGEGVAGLSYQWQSNGVNVTGATNVTLALTNVSATDQSSYDVVISSPYGTITSSIATFTIVGAPQLTPTPATGTLWMNYTGFLWPNAVSSGQAEFPLTYGWQFNGVSITGDSVYFPDGPSSLRLPSLSATNEGAYAVWVTNAAGYANATWNVRIATPGMAEAWGDDAYGESDRPTTLTNAAAIAAGDYDSVALTEAGTVVQWGQFWDGVNYYVLTNPPATNALVGVAASRSHSIAVTGAGSVITWGLGWDPANYVPSGMSPVSAVAAGWSNNLVLFTNGIVWGWGSNGYGQLSIPTNLTTTNAATAIASGALHSLALRGNGTVEAWGYNAYGQTNVPSTLTNAVAIAAGRYHSLALQSNGCVVAWGLNTSGQCTVPVAASNNVMAIAAGAGFSMALKNDGTIVEWGDNTSGESSVPSTLPTVEMFGSGPSIEYVTNAATVVKSIAGGGLHALATVFSPVVQYPVNPTNDLLLIYNASDTDGSNIWRYYVTHRPMAGSALSLGLTNCTGRETFLPAEYTNVFQYQLTNWLSANPTKRPQYVVLFSDVPSRVATITNIEYYYQDTNVHPSIQLLVNRGMASNWHPFVTAINMEGAGGTNDCIQYINKLAAFASNSPSKLFISARSQGYSNTNWIFDDSISNTVQSPPYGYGYQAESGVLSAFPAASVIFSGNNVLTAGTNLAAYYSYGVHNGVWTYDGYWPTNAFALSGSAQWFLMATDESWNGLRAPTGTGSYIQWFASNAFLGTNYSSTPVGAATHISEPGTLEFDTSTLFGLWASGKSLAICAWNSYYNDGAASQFPQIVGDPFVKW